MSRASEWVARVESARRDETSARCARPASFKTPQHGVIKAEVNDAGRCAMSLENPGPPGTRKVVTPEELLEFAAWANLTFGKDG